MRAGRPRGAATPTDPRQAGSGVQLGPPAGHGDQLRPHGGGQLVLKLLPFRRARSSTAPEQRTGPRCTSLLAAPRLGLGQRPRCLSVSAPQVRRTGRPGRHGRRRVAGRSLSALTSLRNGRRGAPPGRAAHCSTTAAAAPSVCLSSPAPLSSQPACVSRRELAPSHATNAHRYARAGR